MFDNIKKGLYFSKMQLLFKKGVEDGRLLYNYAVKKIMKKGIKKLIIGCLDGNPSNNFYKHLGGKYIGNHLFR